VSTYRIKIERDEPMTQEQRDQWTRESYRYSSPSSPPPSVTVEVLSFEADEAQFAAIRRAALEAMK